MVSAPTGTRIRAYFAGKLLADSGQALLIRESPFKMNYAYPDLKKGRPDLRGYILLNWNAMDSWYEEEEEMLGHPRDPFTRIDIRKSSTTRLLRTAPIPGYS
jgi:uncharacterized protein (DUF427 family)